MMSVFNSDLSQVALAFFKHFFSPSGSSFGNFFFLLLFPGTENYRIQLRIRKSCSLIFMPYGISLFLVNTHM